MKMEARRSLCVEDEFYCTVYALMQGSATVCFGYVVTRDGELNQLVDAYFGLESADSAENACLASVLKALYKVHRVEF